MSHAKLRGKIREVFGTQDAFAEAMEMDRSTMSLKLNDKSDWTSPEISRACKLLQIPLEKVHVYFFTT
mgnify:CR=1 FL=1